MQQYPPPQQFRPNMPMPGPGFSMPGGIRPPALSQEQLAVFSRLQSVAQKGGPEGAQAQQQLQMLQIHAAQQQQQMLIQQQQQQQFQQQPPQPHGQPQQPPGGPSQSPPISVNAAQMQALRGMSMGGAGLQGQQGGAASSPQAQAILDAQRMAMAQNAQIREMTGGGSGSGSRAEMGTPTTAGSAGKKKRNRANPAQQTLPRPPPQPRHSDSYRQQSLLPPGPPGGASHAPGSGMHAMPPGPSGPNNAQMQISGYAEAHMIEPWADALDEVDPREMAMGRFRARQELLSEIFSVDPIKDIIEQTADQDPWAGLEMTLDDLNSKVEALEKANADLEASMASSLEAYRQRLIDASTKEVEVA